MYNEKIARLLDGKKAIGFQSLTFDDTIAVSLTIPATPANPEDRTYVAVMVLEADATASDFTKVAHFREDSSGIPTAAAGMTLGHGWIYELIGYEQLANFKIIGVEASKSHVLQVTYYKLGNQ